MTYYCEGLAHTWNDFYICLRCGEGKERAEDLGLACSSDGSVRGFSIYAARLGWIRQQFRDRMIQPRLVCLP